MLTNNSRNGIFNTSVTKEDIEERCRRIFGNSASFGENMTIVNIGEMRGFLSKTCLVKPDWTDSSLNAPDQFVLKISTINPILEISDRLLENKKQPIFEEMDDIKNSKSVLIKIHNNECRLYNLLKKYNPGDLPIVNVFDVEYMNENCEKGFIMMEYMKDNVFISQYENMELELVHKTLRSIAKFQAIGFKFTPEESNFGMDIFNDNIFAIWESQIQQSIFCMLRNFSSNKLEALINDLEAELPNCLDQEFYKNISERIGINKVLSHCDLWSGNIIIVKNEHDQLEPRALIDFQNASFFIPSFDVIRLLCSSLSGKDRRNNFEHLLEIFYNNLKDECVENIPYSLEAFKESAYQLMPLVGFSLLPFFTGLIDLLHDYPAAEQEIMYDRMLEKVSYLLEDVLFYHHRNMKLRNL